MVRLFFLALTVLILGNLVQASDFAFAMDMDCFQAQDHCGEPLADNQSEEGHESCPGPDCQCHHCGHSHNLLVVEIESAFLRDSCPGLNSYPFHQKQTPTAFLSRINRPPIA